MRSFALLFAAATAAAAAPVAPSAFNVAWLSPTLEPGESAGGRSTYQGAMPLGNGRTTALAWANVSAGGVGIYLGSQDAMSSATELFKLALLQVSLTPNPYAAGDHFNQTLDLATATVVVTLGGKNESSFVARLRIWIDANADSLRISVEARDGAAAPFSLRVASSSTRPPSTWTYTPPFFCDAMQSAPDTYVDPLPPAPIALRRAPPQGARDRFRHASGARRPLRRLFEEGGALPPAETSLMPGSLVVFHRNLASDGLVVNATLSAQGLADLVPTTPDHWQDLTSGFVLDSDDGPALTRVDAHTLASAAPAAAFSLRATVLAVQTDTVDEWIADVAALVATSPPSAAARSAHEAWWAAFWNRSHIIVNGSAFPFSAPAPAAAAAVAAAAPVLPVAGAVLWLRADALAGAANGSSVERWSEPSLPASSVAQATASLRPIFVADAFGPGSPAVRFDGVSSFLSSTGGAGPNASLPGADSTHFAVFRDAGSTTACCSGIVYWLGSCVGVGTAATSYADDDDNSTANPAAPVVSQADFPGSAVLGSINLNGRLVQADVSYSAAAGVSISVDGCPQGQAGAVSSASSGVYIGARNNELQRFFRGDIAEIISYPRALSAAEVGSVRAYLAARYPQIPPKEKCGRNEGDLGFRVSQVYAVTRYVQAVQSRGTIWSIKFNGMAFVAARGEDGSPDYRDWGPCNWWQNTRLSYGSMLPAGDVDSFRVILDYYANAEVLLSQRTLKYWSHPGMWTTETHTLFGAYCPNDYLGDSCGNSRAGWPDSLEMSGWLKVDQGGDSGTGEYPLMALDYLLWTNDAAGFAARYAVIATQAAEYFMHHFLNNSRSADGRITVWPAQILESWWCDYDPASGNFSSNCCANDAPTISGMLTLFEKLLSLPDPLVTPAQRAAWTAFSALIPALPLSADGATIVPGEVMSNGGHNGEGPELFAMHPHRWLTKGREVATGRNISLATRTLAASGFAQSNTGCVRWRACLRFPDGHAALASPPISTTRPHAGGTTA
jgi:hypothetical protein